MDNKQPPVKRRHHVVPDFYLRRFADDDGMITRVPLGGGEVKAISTRDATVRRDFYRVDHPELRPDALEDALAEIEDETAPAFVRVVDRGAWPPSSEDRELLATFIALQYLRSQATRSAGEEITRSIGKLEVGIASTDQLREVLELADDTSDEDVEKTRRAMLETANTFTVDRHSHLQFILESLGGTTRLVLGRRPWLLFRWERRSIATSDTPVVLESRGDARFYSDAGFGMAPGLLLPVGRRACMSLGKVGGDGEEEIVAGNTRYARLTNTWTLVNARREALHHPEDDPFAGMTIPEVRDREMDISHRHIESLIEGVARMQGRPSGLPGADSDS